MDLRSPRIVFEEPVLLQTEGIDASIVGRARNLSEGGLFVGDLQDLPPMDSQLQLSFALPDGQAIEAEAKVTRRILTDSPLEPQGIALSFSSVVGEYAEHLRDFIDEERTSPGVDHDKIKLKLDQPDVVVSATARSVSDDLLVAECSLPFLRVGSELVRILTLAEKLWKKTAKNLLNCFRVAIWCLLPQEWAAVRVQAALRSSRTPSHTPKRTCAASSGTPPS